MSVFEEPKVDAHCHVLDPARFAYASDVAYRPAGQEVGPLEQYLQVMDAYGIRQALFVGPNSGYNLDNRCLLDTLARGGGRLRGIAVVRNDASREELQQLQAAGVIGVALNATVQGVDHVLGAGPLFARVADLGMLVSLQAEHEQWVALEPLLQRCEARILVDHAGRPRAGAGLDQPGFAVVLRLAKSGRAAVKLSGWQKFSAMPPPYEDAMPFARALIDAYGLDACLWATDWPFLRAPQRLDVGPLLKVIERLLPDEADRRKLWWETPRRWLAS
jgi:predicted TIM-barrel fold metal-dependent hydrolase